MGGRLAWGVQRTDGVGADGRCWLWCPFSRGGGGNCQGGAGRPVISAGPLGGSAGQAPAERAVWEARVQPVSLATGLFQSQGWRGSVWWEPADLQGSGCTSLWVGRDWEVGQRTASGSGGTGGTGEAAAGFQQEGETCSVQLGDFAVTPLFIPLWSDHRSFSVGIAALGSSVVSHASSPCTRFPLSCVNWIY